MRVVSKILLGTIALVLAACGGAATTGTTGAGGATSSTGATTTTSAGGAGGATTSATTGAGGAATTTTTGTGGAPPMQSGDCASDADCPGSTCVEVTPGGFRVCAFPIPEITTCAGGLGGCCKSGDCPSGLACFPPFYYCGGIVGPQNQCLAPSCQTDTECNKGGAPPSICVKAGVLGRPVNTCMPAACKHDSDCGAGPGGKCQPVDSACCGEIEALYCVYEGQGCRHKKDCGGGFCDNDGSKSYCSGGTPSCPI